MEVNFEFEKQCPHCDGHGYDQQSYFRSDRKVACSFCDGNGVELTEEGKTLAKFIVKYFGVKPLDQVVTENGKLVPSLLRYVDFPTQEDDDETVAQ